MYITSIACAIFMSAFLQRINSISLDDSKGFENGIGKFPDEDANIAVPRKDLNTLLGNKKNVDTMGNVAGKIKDIYEDQTEEQKQAILDMFEKVKEEFASKHGNMKTRLKYPEREGVRLNKI